jgi:hypothetical protein
MFLPLVILVCLLVIALVPTGFNGVVVGYMWSILVSFPPPPSFVNYYVQKAVHKLWRKNCQDEFASDLQFLYGKYMQHGTILILKPEN